MPRKKVKKPPILRKVKAKATRKVTPEPVFICPECKCAPDWYFCALTGEWICCGCGAVLSEDEADNLVPKYKLDREFYS